MKTSGLQGKVQLVSASRDGRTGSPISCRSSESLPGQPPCWPCSLVACASRHASEFRVLACICVQDIGQT